MNRSKCRISLPSTLAASALATALMLTPAAAQEVNKLDSALSINGTGRVNAAGGIRTTSSSVFPTPPGSAPLYHHRSQARSALEFRIQGAAPGTPVILLMGPIAATGIPLAGEIIELDLANSIILINGLDPLNLINASAFLGPNGSWTMILNQGLPAGTPKLGFQAIVFDPTAPLGFRLTGSITLEVDNNLDTLTRNVVDSFFEAPVNPLYILSLTSSNFLLSGNSALQFFGQAAGLTPFGGEGSAEDLVFMGIGPNVNTAPALPTGPPVTGANETFYLDVAGRFRSNCTALAMLGERSRNYEFKAVESLGVWKFHGDQQDAHVEIDLAFEPGTTNPQGIRTYMRVLVEEEFGRNGGIASVSVSGPQLANLNGNQEATSSASGSQPLQFSGSCGGSCTEWKLNVELAAAAAGTSRLPWVETASGVRDVYNITIQWNDGSSSGPYSVPLRAAVTPDINPQSVLDAIPGNGAIPPSAVLLAAGTANATLALTFDAGTIPNPGFDSHISVHIYQSNNQWKFEENMIPANGAMQTMQLCTPGLQSGVPIDVEMRRQDVFEIKYYQFVTISL